MVDPTAKESQILFDGAHDADSLAQRDLHDRYANRLIALVRSKLGQKFRSRLDAEDIVNSAFQSFFSALTADRFVLPPHGGLWPLLAQITLHKLHRATRHHTRHRRNIDAQQRLADIADVAQDDFAGTAEVALRDELQWLAGKLSEKAMLAIELSLQGESQQRIAEQLDCNPRTVRRYLAEARSLLRFRLSDLLPAGHDADQTQDPANGLNFDNYLLRRMVGSGSYAKVYLATDKTTGNDVAIKYLRKRWMNDRSAVRRFIAETQLVRKLDIAGIVPCFGGGVTGEGSRFIVMQWIDGETLADRITRKPLREAEAQSKFTLLAQTLGEIHKRGILHCDLKPSNILIDSGGRWWLADFGFAQRFDAPSLVVAGTPAYMAPEQLDPFFGPLGPATDLYATGVILLHALTGVQPPSNANLDNRWIDGLITGSKGLSGPLASLIRDLTQRRSRDRIGTASTLVQRLTNMQ